METHTFRTETVQTHRDASKSTSETGSFPTQGPSPFAPPGLERWLAKYELFFLPAILGLALLVRAVYFVQVADTPCAVQHKWRQSDMHFFDTWARELSGGDWLTAQALHPQHLWHRAVAEEYLRLRPEELTTILQAAPPAANAADLSKALWNRWYGGKRFHQEPLYPYLVGLTYTLFGADVRHVFAWQMLVGVASIYLVYRLTRRHFGYTAAVAASLFALCYPAPLMYEAVLLRTTLIVFAGLLNVLTLDWALSRGGAHRWFLTGVTIGGAVLLKVTFALFLLAGLVLVILYSRGAWAQAAKWSAAAVVGVAVALTPAIARNTAVGVGPLSLSSVGTATFVLSSAVDYRPEADNFALEHAARIFGDTDGRFLPSVVETIATHPHLGSYLHQVVSKFFWVWHWYERPNNVNFYFFQTYVPILRWLFVSFGLIAPMGFLGLLLALSQRTRPWTLFVPLLTSLISLVLFFLSSRYRVPLVVALTPFAGLAVAGLLGYGSRRQLGRLLFTVMCLACLLLWCNRSLPANAALLRDVDYMAAYQSYYEPKAQELQRRGDLEGAGQLMAASLKNAPAAIHLFGSGEISVVQAEWQPLVRFYADVHNRYAALLEGAEKPEEAAEQRQIAQRLRKLVTPTPSTESGLGKEVE